MSPKPVTLDRFGYVRDSRRQKLYDAEGYIRTGPMMTLVEIDTYVRALLDEKWTRRHWRIRESNYPTITDGRGSSDARYDSHDNQLEFPRWSRTEMVVLHEVAHYLARKCQDSCNGPHAPGRRHCAYEAHHGWHFAKIMLMLVRHKMGKDWHDRLRTAYKDHHVRYTKPRTLTPEARRAAADRLAAYRVVATKEH